MSKFISVKVFRGSFPEDKEIGQFAGKRGACFRVATEDDAHVKRSTYLNRLLTQTILKTWIELKA